MFQRGTRSNPFFFSMAALLTPALLSLGISEAQGATEGASGSQSAKRIGVVSVSSVFKAYKKVKDIQTLLEAEFDPRKRDLESRGKKLQDWETQLKHESTDDKGEKRDKLVQIQQFELAKFDLEKDFRKLAMDVEEKRMEEMRQVLREIRAAIKSTATEQQFDLILRAPEYDEEGSPVAPAEEKEDVDMKPKTSSELVRRFKENPVLSYSPNIDLTQTVVSKLNDSYSAAEKGTAK